MRPQTMTPITMLAIHAPLHSEPMLPDCWLAPTGSPHLVHCAEVSWLQPAVSSRTAAPATALRGVRTRCTRRPSIGTHGGATLNCRQPNAKPPPDDESRKAVWYKEPLRGARASVEGVP